MDFEEALRQQQRGCILDVCSGRFLEAQAHVKCMKADDLVERMES